MALGHRKGINVSKHWHAALKRKCGRMRKFGPYVESIFAEYFERNGWPLPKGIDALDDDSEPADPGGNGRDDATTAQGHAVAQIGS